MVPSHRAAGERGHDDEATGYGRCRPDWTASHSRFHRSQPTTIRQSVVRTQGVTRSIDQVEPTIKTRAARVVSGQPAAKNEGLLGYGRSNDRASVTEGGVSRRRSNLASQPTTIRQSVVRMQAVTRSIDQVEPTIKTRAARVVSGQPAAKHRGLLGRRGSSPSLIQLERERTQQTPAGGWSAKVS